MKKQPDFLPSVEAGKLRPEGEKLLPPLSPDGPPPRQRTGWQVHQFLTDLQADMDRFDTFL